MFSAQIGGIRAQFLLLPSFIAQSAARNKILTRIETIIFTDCKATILLLRCAVLEPFHRSQLSAVAARLTILAHTRVVEDEWCQLLETLHLAVVEELSMIEIRR